MSYSRNTSYQGTNVIPGPTQFIMQELLLTYVRSVYN
jgi:hypothetical protein